MKIVLRVPNFGIGSPIKRFIDGIFYWREERAIRTWFKQIKAVRKHNRIQRRYERKRRGMKKREYIKWQAQLEQDELREMI